MQELSVQIGGLEYLIDIPNLITLVDNTNTYVERVNDRVILKRAFVDAQVSNVCRYKIQVHDGEVRVLEHDQSEFQNSRFNDRRINSTEGSNSILLILESPHKDEIIIVDNNLMSKAPAQGTTGNQLKSKLASVLEHNMSVLNLSGEYHFNIVNPVRMQTSLFALHGKSLKEKEYVALRDEIWRLMWITHPNYKNEFNELLRNTRPSIIINACTANLKKEVNSEIPANMRLFEVSHPSSWVYKKADRISIEELIWSEVHNTYIKSVTNVRLNTAV